MCTAEPRSLDIPFFSVPMIWGRHAWVPVGQPTGCVNERERMRGGGAGLERGSCESVCRSETRLDTQASLGRLSCPHGSARTALLLLCQGTARRSAGAPEASIDGSGLGLPVLCDSNPHAFRQCAPQLSFVLVPQPGAGGKEGTSKSMHAKQHHRRPGRRPFPYAYHRLSTGGRARRGRGRAQGGSKGGEVR
jgi:hypothetical protein